MQKIKDSLLTLLEQHQKRLPGLNGVHEVRITPTELHSLHLSMGYVFGVGVCLNGDNLFSVMY